jgi:NAD(P)-dependent dehydrogenase (short-subunit alcohol dehydrogenase family)
MSANTPEARTVVVTGAGSGIGLAIANAFAAAGDTVYACDVNGDRLEHATAALGPSVHARVADVSSYDEVEQLIQTAKTETGRLDVLVNNAGIADGKADITQTSLDLWRRIMSINLDGCFHGCKAAAAIMIEQGHGRIVNMSSISSFKGAVNGVAYTASKCAIVGLTKRVAADLGPSGITVNAVCPGSIVTAIGANSEALLGAAYPSGNQSTTSDERIRELVPTGRRGSADEVAATVLFLASAEAGYINGAEIPVDGGWVAM